MITAANIASLLAIVGLALAAMIVRGLLPHSFVKAEGPTYRLSAGINLIILAYVARSIYWEWLPLFLLDYWPVWYGMTGLAVNLIFSALFIRGLLHLLVLLWLLIPVEDRLLWSVWGAPWYPNHNPFTRFTVTLRNQWRASAKRRTKD
jgi:hypothetical protein